MPFDSAFWPLIMFLPFFVWIMFFQVRRNTPLTPAERRRALVVGSIASGLGIVLGVIGLCYLVKPPSPPVPALRPQAQAVPAQAVPAPAPAVPPPARAPQLR